MAADRDRFSTTTRLRAFGSALVQNQAARVYRVRSRRVRRPPRRSRLTGRAALLALVVCTLVVALAYPTRQYVAQRTDIAEQQGEVDRAREEVRRLREEVARWQDPAYVEQQARERLHFVRPGERSYVLQDGQAGESTASPDGAPGSARHTERDADAPDVAWYDNLWRQLDAADRER